MRVMVLGSGPNQLKSIKSLKKRGHFVIASDYCADSIGKKSADLAVVADTFSYEQTLRQALATKAEALMVFATDQPVLTAARVSETLGLYYPISAEVALNVTNKKHMKRCFVEGGIATLPHAFIRCSKDFDKVKHFDFPAVLKPVDSQGQRGIFKVYSKVEAINKLPLTLRESKTDTALLEMYYPNREITVSGWVDGKETIILAVTDRVTFDSDDKIGICISHEHPSIQTVQFGDQIASLTKKIVAHFKIVAGPIYFQFLVGERGIFANEIACRIGGAHEDVFIKEITGFDILDAQIRLFERKSIDLTAWSNYDFKKNAIPLSVQLFFARAGIVAKTQMPNALSGLIGSGFHYNVGDEIKQTCNASARAGYAIMRADTENALVQCIERFYDNAQLFNKQMAPLIIRGKRGYR